MSEHKNSRSLFRKEVSAAQRLQWLGEIVLLRPISFRIIAASAALLAIFLLALLCFGHYTKRTQAQGILFPVTGIIKVQSHQNGILVERLVREGQSVEKGDALLALSGEVNLTPTQDADASILVSLEARKQSLEEEKREQDKLTEFRQIQLQRNVQNLTEQNIQLEKEVQLQETRSLSLQTQWQRQEQLSKEKFISELALSQKRDELLDQQARLQNLRRNQTALYKDISDAKSELEMLSIKAKREQSQLSRQISEISQSQVLAKARRQFIVTAPNAGTVTAIQAELGQLVSNQTLLSIVPDDAQLEAQIFVSSRSVGFIEPGQNVKIRYPAYPYQKFGHQDGVVVDISRIALAAKDLPLTVSRGNDNDSFFRVRVKLAKQHILAYGKPQELTAGLQLEADIMQDRRTLIEWVVEPLYTVSGKV